MAGSMKSVTETGIELSNEERNLLSVAYKVRRWQQVLDALKSPKESHLRQNFKWRKNIFFVIQEKDLGWFTSGTNTRTTEEHLDYFFWLKIKISENS